MYKLVLIRHGESQWNLENRFTGWHDVDLTDTGVAQAKMPVNCCRMPALNLILPTRQSCCVQSKPLTWHLKKWASTTCR